MAHGDHVAEHWYDYGAFCLLDSDIDQAEQCFKEAVSLDQTLVPALVACIMSIIILLLSAKHIVRVNLLYK